MSAKPRFKPRLGWAPSNENATFAVFENPTSVCKTRVRVTDARDLTAEKAVEKVLQNVWSGWGDPKSASDFKQINVMANTAGMTAYIVDGKVRVRRGKQ